MQNLRPLPKEILEMSEAETACEYCGISYLLLQKYEKMKELVRSLEEEQAALRDKQLIEHLQSTQTQISEEMLSLQEHVSSLETANHNLRESKRALKQEISNLETDQHILENKYHRGLKTIQSEMIGLRNQLAFIKGDARNILSRIIPETVQQAINSMAENFKSHLLKLPNYSINTKSESEQISKLEQELQIANSNLEDSAKRVSRLTGELKSQKSEFNIHIQAHKQNAKSFQDFINSAESRIELAQQELINLAKERDNIDEDRKKAKELLGKLRESSQNQLREAEIKIMTLQKEISNIKVENERLLEAKNSNAPPRNSENVTLNQLLSSKNEQLLRLEVTIRDLNMQLANARKERQMTVDAHQSRIQQLQDKFLVDLDAAVKRNVSETEEDISRKCEKEQQRALQEQKNILEEQWQKERITLYDEIDKLKKSLEKLHSQFRIESAKRNKSIQAEIVAERQELIEKINHQRHEYDQRIRVLNEKLQDALAMRDPAIFGADEKIERLKAAIKQKDSEILFLKDTVRIECEERMGLVASITALQQKANLPPIINEKRDLPKEKESTSIESNGEPSLNAKERQILSLFKRASIKNGKRLMKQPKIL